MLLQNSKNKEWSKQLKTTAQARKNTEYCIQGVQTERLNLMSKLYVRGCNCKEK